MTSEDIHAHKDLQNEVVHIVTIDKINFVGSIEGISETGLQQMAVLAHEINFYLHTPVETIKIDPDMDEGGSASGDVVEIAKRLFNAPKEQLYPTTWHELAHKFYQELRGDSLNYLRTNKWLPYGEEFNSLYVKAVTSSLTKPESTRVSTISNMMDWQEFKDNSIIAIFNPANYRESDPDREHPQWHSGELFAYASEIMRYYPDKVIERLGQLNTEEEKELASQILDKVAFVYTSQVDHPQSLSGLRKFLATPSSS